MKKVLRAFVGTALSLCLVGALSMAAPTAKNAPISTGDFVVSLVRAMNPKAPAGLTAEAAVKELSRLGITVSGSFKDTLKEGQLVSILRQLGVNVRAANPAREVSVAKATNVISTFRVELGKAAAGAGIVAAGNGGDDFNNGNGKGGKFKRKANLSPGVPPGQTD